jgi:NTP pyrophosphatase (non-canonical NTP hydrolase)
MKDELISYDFLDECNQITQEYEKKCGRWSLDSQLLHIVTEIAEFKDVVRNKNEKYGKEYSNEYGDKLLDEFADIILTTLATANFLAISPASINQALDKKLQIVKERVLELKAQ